MNIAKHIIQPQPKPTKELPPNCYWYFRADLNRWIVISIPQD